MTSRTPASQGAPTLRPKASWLPGALGALVLVVSVVVWRGLVRAEDAQLLNLVQAVVTNSERVAEERLANRVDALLRMAGRWESNGRPDRDLWEADARAYLDDGVAGWALMWTDSSGVVRWAVSVGDPPPERLSGLPRTEVGRVSLWTVPGRVALVTPLGTPAGSDGFLMGLSEAGAFVESIFSERPSWSSRAVRTSTGLVLGQEELEGRPAAGRWVQERWVAAGADSLLLEVSPQENNVLDARSSMPLVVLVLGGLLSGALAFSVAFASSARASAVEMDTFFQASPDMLCVAGTDGCVRRVNPRFTFRLGWSPADLVARPLIDLVHPEDRPETEARMGRLSDGGDVVGFRTRLATREGEYRWLQWSMAQFRGTVYAVARDMTEEVESAEALAERAERLSAHS